MKPPVIFSYAVFFIITTQSLIPSITVSGDHVYDVNKKKVLNDVFYHIGPVKGGTIKYTDTKDGKKACPVYVVQDPAAITKGDKFLFTLISDKEKQETYLETSHILGIDSGIPKAGSCSKGGIFWKISEPESKPPSNLITSGGVFEEDLSCFQVVDYPKPTNPKVHSYMLQHCPAFCGGPPPFVCYNVTLYEEKGVKYLASRGGTPFEFVFQKA